jgi:hypothetical protein
MYRACLQYRSDYATFFYDIVRPKFLFLVHIESALLWHLPSGIAMVFPCGLVPTHDGALRLLKHHHVAPMPQRLKILAIRF